MNFVQVVICLLRKLEMTGLHENLFYWLAEKFLVNTGSFKCLRKEKHALLIGKTTSIPLILSLNTSFRFFINMVSIISTDLLNILVWIFQENLYQTYAPDNLSRLSGNF